MEKTNSHKGKSKKQSGSKQKTVKKRKSEGPSCSMFLVELSRKLAAKKRDIEEAPKNIIQTIIDSITNALPVKISKSSPPKIASPTKIEVAATIDPPIEAPPQLPSPTPLPEPVQETKEVIVKDVEKPSPTEKAKFKIPKMPLVDSDMSKAQQKLRQSAIMADADTSTVAEHDGATEITKYVSTLRKISLIAEEFNQKTAKNLKEIVDSVQDDLIKKLEEIQAEQKAQTVAQAQILKIKENS